MQRDLPDFRRVYLALGVVALAWPTGILLVPETTGAMGALLVAMVTATITAIIGIPLAHLFVKRAWFESWKSALAGGAIGAVCWLLFVHVAATQFRIAMNFVAIGALHGFVFWLVAFWRNGALRPK